MKISLAMMLAAVLLSAGCSRPAAQKQSASPEIRQGLELAEKSQCLSCHALDHKVIGPAWNDVSARYNQYIRSGKTSEQEVEKTLEKKIAMGGKGNWIWVTGGMSMPPNAPRVSAENIRKLTHFILSLRKG